MPPSPPEKTGTPTAPINMYTSTEIVPDAPRTDAAMYMAKVAREIGITPIGREKGETIHNIAANNDKNTSFLVLIVTNFLLLCFY